MSAAVAMRPYQSVQQSAGRVTLSFERITPSTAKAWLAKLNTRNFRKLSDYTKAKYADDMVAGNFGATPEMASESNIVICVDPETGEEFLGNGQHRLAACVAAHERTGTYKGFWCGVMRGIDPLAMLRMDVGKKRTMADSLRFLGCPNPAILASALRVLYTYKYRPDQLATGLAGTPDQLLHLLENRQDINRAVTFAATNGTGKKIIPMTTSWLSVARLLISEVPNAQDDVDFFWAALARRDTPNELAVPNHPIVQLRGILDTKGTRALSQFRMPTPTLFGTVLKAWNMYRDDSRKNLVFTPGGQGAEKWPIPR